MPAPASIRSTLRALALVLLVKLVAGAAVLASGFVAVSDDDFARVVLAQRWAAAPALDPTGTSWLPLPFWLSGGVMLVAGRSLEVARATAFVLGLVAAGLLYGAARLLVDDRRAALCGALVAAALPWSARLGVATVPELPAAALSVLAVATLARPSPRWRVLGGGALVVACLSRYEPWIVAAGFCGYTAIDLWRARAGWEARSAGYIAALLLAAAGPLGWMGYNRLAHGSALHFATRVSAYAHALGGGGSLGALWGYPLSLVREEPELCVLAVALLIAGWWQQRAAGTRPTGGWLPSSLLRVAVVLLGAVLILALAALPGGAPTHHAGRVLLAVWLAMAVYVGAGGWWALRRPGSPRRLLSALLALLLPVGALVLRPWYARLDAFTARASERAIGATAAQRLPPRARVLLEVVDYGYFAVEAASGRPEMWVRDRSIDPRKHPVASSFISRAALRARAQQAGAMLVAGHDGPALRSAGRTVAQAGGWRLVRLFSRR